MQSLLLWWTVAVPLKIDGRKKLIKKSKKPFAKKQKKKRKRWNCFFWVSAYIHSFVVSSNVVKLCFNLPKIAIVLIPGCRYYLIRYQKWSPRGRPWPRGHILKSLASKVKSLASSPRKLACPRLEDSTIFWIVKISWSAWKIFWKTFFLWRPLEKFLWRPFFFFWRALALVSLVLGLGLEHSCPWPPEVLSSERLSLALDFFVSLALALASGFVSSTPPLFATSKVTMLILNLAAKLAKLWKKILLPGFW